MRVDEIWSRFAQISPEKTAWYRSRLNAKVTTSSDLCARLVNQGMNVTTHPFTIEIGVLCLPDHLSGPSCERDLDGDEWIVTHRSH